MKKNNVSILVALLLMIVIIIGGTFIIDMFDNKGSKIYTSKNKDNVKNSNEIEEDKASETSLNDMNTNDTIIVIQDTSSAKVIEASNIGSDIIVDSTASTDNQTLEYFQIAENKINLMYDDLDKIKTEGKALFVKLVDFIFYDTEINGIKFNDLTASTKEKLVSIVNSIDNKIESKLPGYKETVVDYAGKTYTYLSAKLKQGITYIDTRINENVDSNIYTEVKEETSSAIDTIKESVNTAVDISKDVITTSKEKLKEWYEGWK